jgi:hypothetical protein
MAARLVPDTLRIAYGGERDVDLLDVRFGLIAKPLRER